jgi:uncharacterized membrane protein YbjE (DUF340 family)
MNFYYHKVIKLNILRFFKELLNKTFLTMILILVLGYFINMIPGVGWFNFILKSSIYSIFYGILMFSFGIIDFERELIKNTLKPILKKKHKCLN